MEKEAYIEIDGKRTKLTDEQMKALGLYKEPKVNPFERLKNKYEIYYYIDSDGYVISEKEQFMITDQDFFDIANYCTDKEILQQRALHETLNRLLWRFSMKNNGDKIDWNNHNKVKASIYYNYRIQNFNIRYDYYCQDMTIYFFTREIAQRAIDEIIIPFMKEHPDFVW